MLTKACYLNFTQAEATAEPLARSSWGEKINTSHHKQSETMQPASQATEASSWSGYTHTHTHRGKPQPQNITESSGPPVPLLALLDTNAVGIVHGHFSGSRRAPPGLTRGAWRHTSWCYWSGTSAISIWPRVKWRTCGGDGSWGKSPEVCSAGAGLPHFAFSWVPACPGCLHVNRGVVTLN